MVVEVSECHLTSIAVAGIDLRNFSIRMNVTAGVKPLFAFALAAFVFTAASEGQTQSVTSSAVPAGTPSSAANSPSQSGPSQPSKEKTYSRDEVAGLLAANRKIVTPNGVEKLISVQINGTTQWLSIRGKDRRNPILLFLHGGPGIPFMPFAWTIQSPWEEYFTVVQWDQRGAGKTYGANDPNAIAPTMTVAQMTDDATEVVRYLEKEYGKQKIFILGHSWGNVLAMALAQKHPEWFYAYLSVGQVVDMQRNEADGYRFALEQARSHQNADAEKELLAIAPYPGDPAKFTPEKVGIQRKWVISYGGFVYGANLNGFGAAVSLSPDYSSRDVDAFGASNQFSVSQMFEAMVKIDNTSVTDFKCPVFLFEGRHDYVTSSATAAEWFGSVKAPAKKLVWFENSGHMVMLEEPGRFFYHLVSYLRPLAAQAGDTAPDNAVVSPDE
jgi:pimeloyl-ACP methyl ester carboxylesterase